MLTRFAPSPTGELHLVHAYSAVLAHAAARGAGGTFRIRIDDIDGSRSREAYVGAALADLAWLGIDWDGDPVRQSDRLGHYAAALDTLRTRGLVYPCFCTRTDIAASLSAPHGPSGAIYPGTCRNLHPVERGRRMIAEPHCWRLDMARAAASAGEPLWEEAGQGMRAELDGLLEIMGIEAGLQTAAWLGEGINGAEAVRAAADRGVEVHALSRYARQPMAREGLQLGFAAVDPDEIRRGVRDLRAALLRVRR